MQQLNTISSSRINSTIEGTQMDSNKMGSTEGRLISSHSISKRKVQEVGSLLLITCKATVQRLEQQRNTHQIRE